MSIPDFPVTDIEFVKGLHLNKLDVSNTKIKTIRFLRGMKLVDLDISGLQLDTLGPIAGMPIEVLFAWDVRAHDYEYLATLSRLRVLLAPTKIDVHDLPRSLETVDFTLSEVLNIDELSSFHKLVSLALPPVSSNISFCANLSLEKLDISNSEVTDLSALTKLPLNTIFLAMTNVEDISPLCDTPVERVFAEGSKIGSLVNMKLCKIRILDISNCEVSSLEGIEKLPFLTEIDISKTRIKDFDRLRRVRTLEEVTFTNNRGETVSCYRRVKESQYWNMFFSE